MALSSTTIKEIVRHSNVIVDNSYTSLTMKDIVRIAVSNGTHVTILVSPDGGYTSLTLKEIARIGGVNVTFRFL